MVVFFDIDGTIVDDATQIIPESTTNAIRLLRENGHLPVVNTGRPFAHIDPRVRAMDFGGWVCACGMQVILDNEYLYRDRPAPGWSRKIMELARETGMLLLAEGEEKLYFDSAVDYSTAPWMECECARKRGSGLADLQQTAHPEFLKFVTQDGPNCRRERFLSEISNEFDAIDRGGSTLEFVKKGNSKARGMERLLEALNVPKEETFAIGDSTNDLPMFAIAGTTICMGNGMEELKSRADFITGTVLEDGISTALRQFGLI